MVELIKYPFFSFLTGGEPFYTSNNPITDIAVSPGGAQTFGQGCAGAKGVPQMGFGLNGYPYLGNQKFQISMENGPASTPDRLILGLSNKTWNGSPLPVDLGVIGAPQCSLHVAMLFELGIQTDANGEAILAVAVPMDPALTGFALYAQFGIFEQGANPANLITTDGLELIFR